MNFVKKNIPLVIVLSVTAIISLFLIYLVYISHKEVSNAFTIIDSLDKELQDLYSRPLKPVAANYEMITKDREELIFKTKDVQNYFGKPYRRALQNFAAALGEDEFTISGAFRTFYEGLDKGTFSNDSVQLVEAFLNAVFPDKDAGAVAKAYQIFAYSAQYPYAEDIEKIIAEDKDKETPSTSKNKEYKALEDIVGNEEGTAQIFLSALGTPRYMPPSKTKTFIASIQQSMRDRRIIPMENRETLDSAIVLDNVKKLTIDIGTGTPPIDNIVPFFRHFQVFEDFFQRLNVSKITSLQKLTWDSPFGTSFNGNQYLKYTYTAEVKGDFASIRNLVNQLQNAYHDDRVYIIKLASMSRDAGNDLQTAFEVATPVIREIAARMTMPAASGGRLAPVAGTRLPPGLRGMNEFNTAAPQRQPDTTNEYVNSPAKNGAYGSVLIGANRNVTAVIEFDYVIFIGDELQPMR